MSRVTPSQTQTQPLYREVILDWTPMLLKRISGALKPMYRTQTGLVIYHPEKIYSVPARFRVLAPENLKELIGQVVIVRIEKMKTINNFTKYTGPATVTQITILPPKQKPKSVKYRLIIYRHHGKSTIKTGSTRDLELVNEDKMKLVLSFYNVSDSGAHWVKWLVIVAPVDVPPLARETWISNRGCYYEHLIDLANDKYVPRYEVLKEVRSWGWGRVLWVRDNITNAVFTAVELEYHRARKTSAKTVHYIEPSDAVELVYSEGTGLDRTHWVEFYKVLKPCIIRTIRTTNSGNIYTVEIVITPDMLV